MTPMTTEAKILKWPPSQLPLGPYMGWLQQSKLKQDLAASKDFFLLPYLALTLVRR